MTKFQQLEYLRELGLPTPPFRRLSYDAFLAGDVSTAGLCFPVAVRSSFVAEDGEQFSQAGRYQTRLWVEAAHLSAAIQAVFDSYPEPEGQEVILQEMVQADFSGVLFAFRHGLWKVEWIEGGGAELVSGRQTPNTLLLPRFTKRDAWFSSWWTFWSGLQNRSASDNRSLIRLAAGTNRLLETLKNEHGLDIEFSCSRGQLFFLQARPLTTPAEAEELLTAANHKEILPPHPSRLMTDLIVKAGPRLFDYYRRLDSRLPVRSFTREAAGMPWINLSALLDIMVDWGLPSSLVCRSVGADDPYKIGLRPWQSLSRWRVFVGLLAGQFGNRRRVNQWLDHSRGRLHWRRKERELWRRRDPAAVVESWLEDFQEIYVGLVSLMQQLTAAMSGPIHWLDRLGYLPYLRQPSASTDYLKAFRQLQSGLLSREEFLQKYGHRGFYESDIGQPRFADFSEADWRSLLIPAEIWPQNPTAGLSKKDSFSLLAWLLSPIARLVHTRESLRHEAMRFFQELRLEIGAVFAELYGEGFPWWNYRPEEWKDLLGGRLSPTELPVPEPPSGWDMNTFLCNQLGRRLPLNKVPSVFPDQSSSPMGIGIFPGKIRGQVWKVAAATLDELQPPPFRPLILVAEALDPGWIPFFSRVDGVISYTGGLLSHASIILRESGIPSITQLSTTITLQTGDWIEMDGQTGRVRKLGEGEMG